MSLSEQEWTEITESATAAEETTETAEEAPAVTEEESAAHTSETLEKEPDTAAPEEVAAAEETQENETAEESETVEAKSDDDFTDLFNAIPTADDINTKFSRIPKDARGEMITLADRARTAEATLSELGDEKMVNIIKPFAPLLAKTQTTEAERLPALKNIIDANWGVGLEIFGDAASFLLEDYSANPNISKQVAQDIRAFGDAIVEDKIGADINTLRGYAQLKTDYGEKASPQHIAELLKLEDAGYIDLENDLENFKSTFGGSEVYEQQKQRILALEAREKEILANPAQFLSDKTSIDSTSALQELETTFLDKVEAGITPIQERGKWKPDSTLTKITKTAILADLRNEPEYKEAVKHIRATGVFNADNMVIHTSINNLSNKARGRFAEAIRGINSELRGQTETSLNAQHQKKAPPTKPQAVEMKASTPNYRDPDKELDGIWGEYDAMKSDAAAARSRTVGTR